MLGFKPADGARMVVQEDVLDDSTRCGHCGMIEHLAYVCAQCTGVHCPRCIGFEAHRCSVWEASEKAKEEEAQRRPPSSVRKFSECSFEGCTEKLMVDMRCHYCRLVFCSSHKMESDHPCTRATVEKRRQVPVAPKPASRLLSGSKASTAARPTLCFPSDVHVDDRFLVKVALPPPALLGVTTLKHDSPLQVIAHKKWGLGRVADALSKELSLSLPSSDRLIFVAMTNLQALSSIDSFADLLRKGKVAKGETLVFLPHSLYQKLREEGAEVLRAREAEAMAGLAGSCKAQAAAGTRLWEEFASQCTAQVA